METPETTLEQITVYDFDELVSDTDHPAKAVCLAVRPLIESIIENPARSRDVNHGILEIIKNVELHGVEDRPRLVLVSRDLGGVAIDTVNAIKEDSGQFGYGQDYLDRIFGDDYSHVIEGNTYMGHLYIPRDIHEPDRVYAA